jgi:hypothetical protein
MGLATCPVTAFGLSRLVAGSGAAVFIDLLE